MKFAPIMLLGALLSAVQAYTPPVTQEDGVYSVDFDNQGNPITQRLEALPQQPDNVLDPVVPPTTTIIKPRAFNRRSSALQPRDFPGQQVSCTNRRLYEQDNYHRVEDCLGRFLNTNSGASRSSSVYYCRAGEMLLAICNYPDTLYGSSGEINNFNGVMDRTCGSWWSGWVFIRDWNKTYWRTTWGESICDNLGGRKQVG